MLSETNGRQMNTLNSDAKGCKKIEQLIFRQNKTDFKKKYFYFLENSLKVLCEKSR